VKAIIEVALNGGTPKSANPHSPRTLDEIAADALACVRAGAAIVHNHNDEPVIGGPSEVHSAEPYREAWRAILAEAPGTLLYPTMAGGGPATDIRRRYAHMVTLAEAGLTRLGLIDPGSVNVGRVDPDGLPAAVESVYINTPADTRYMVETCRRLGLAASVSCFEPGFVRAAVAYHRAGMLAPGTMIKLYFGGPRGAWGLPPGRASLDAYLSLLEGTGLSWSAAVLGGDVFAGGFGRMVLERGGHLRVGLEDYGGEGQPSNVELVERAVAAAAAAGREPSTAAEAAALLGIAV
jgi:uncharacterized protein (DUF849 family)